MRIPLRPIAALGVCGLIALIYSEAFSGTGTISQHLGDAAQVPGATEVDLTTLTSFGWDRFYAFGPGVTRDEVCRFIHASSNICKRVNRLDKAPDDHTYLEFSLQGKVTHVELHALSNGQFDFAMPEDGQPRDQTVFKVRHSAGPEGDLVLLEPK